jgi:hypothetical protein
VRYFEDYARQNVQKMHNSISLSEVLTVVSRWRGTWSLICFTHKYRRFGETTLKMKETVCRNVATHLSNYITSCPSHNNVIFEGQRHVREPGIGGRIRVHRPPTLFPTPKFIAAKLATTFTLFLASCWACYSTLHTYETSSAVYKHNERGMISRCIGCKFKEVLQILWTSFRGVSWREWLSWDGNLIMLLRSLSLEKIESTDFFVNISWIFIIW